MANVIIDTNDKKGIIKPMHAVNNGPSHKFSADQRISNLEAYKAAGIPYARNHDAAFYATYGGEHTVDISAIFPDFDKDPYDESSYDFAVTDEYIRVTEAAGAKTFYRLGSKIEHGVKKYGTLPPKDFRKWAVICEHVIRHYTEGWADGFRYDIEYWEIWNEPDLDPDDAAPIEKKTWGGVAAQFYELFNITLAHLKKSFPHLKIGGPALSHIYREPWITNFFAAVKQQPDFFSWHVYASSPDDIVEHVRAANAMLEKAGWKNCESILNEWNYVREWAGEGFYYSRKQIKGLKGSAFTASTFSACQYEPVDMLMYYDARPGGFNGLFDTDFPCECLKGYYPFKAFNELYKLKNCVGVKCEKDIYACAAISDDEQRLAVMVSHFNDNDDTPAKKLNLSFADFGDDLCVEVFCLDDDHDLELIKTETAVSGKIELELPLYTTYYVNITKNG